MVDSVLAGDYDEAIGDSRFAACQNGRQFPSQYRQLEVIIGLCMNTPRWISDLDRLGNKAAVFKAKSIIPMQDLMNTMSMIPKKAKGENIE